ncbi:unnamed protein product [Lathyrus sativus]|nr:unnamed protein product [Lathyrus sativus]
MERLDDKMYESTRISVLVNSNPTSEFDVGRGLRQGDPLAPFLFLIAVEGLSLMMSKSVQLNKFEGYEFGSGEVFVSHLQYANDTLIMERSAGKI